MIRILIALFFVSVSAQAAPLSHRCSTVAEWSYCISQVAGSQSPDVIYYFTGLGESVHAWDAGKENENTSYLGLIRQTWESAKESYEKKRGDLTRDFPAVVTITIREGVTGLYLFNSNRIRFIIEKLLPEIEQKLGFIPKKRHLFGHSMGAFNTLQAASVLKDVSSIVIGCPMLTRLGPLSSPEEISNYIREQKADQRKVELLVAGIKAEFPEDVEWEKVNPLVFSKKGQLPKVPIYLAPNSDDEYGFFEGAYELSKILNLGAYDLKFVPISGKHCIGIDGVGIGRFLFRAGSSHKKAP